MFAGLLTDQEQNELVQMIRSKSSQLKAILGRVSREPPVPVALQPTSSYSSYCSGGSRLALTRLVHLASNLQRESKAGCFGMGPKWFPTEGLSCSDDSLDNEEYVSDANVQRGRTKTTSLQE